MNKASVPHKQLHTFILFAVLILIFMSVFLLSLFIGRYDVSPAEIFSLFSGKSGNASATIKQVVLDMRLPRVFTAALVGMSLSASGAAFQGIMKNPMVSPDILGASAGACFGAAIGILFSFNALGIELIAFSFGIAAVALTYAISRLFSRGMNPVLMIVLSGMVVSNLFSSGISFIKFIADPNSKLPEITFWLMGGLSSVTSRDAAILAVPFALGIIPLFLLRWRLNVMTLGDEEAASLGLSVSRLRLLVIICATLITSASAAVSGMVGWVGLIIPHLSRLIAGPNYSRLFPASVLAGGIFLMLADNAARVLYTAEIPISILTSVIGAPMFVLLIAGYGKRTGQ